MTKVYCCNFMEQMYQWFEYRKSNWWSFSLYLIKLLSKMVGWKEQESETELPGTSNFQSPILKVWAKTSFFNISHKYRKTSKNISRCFKRRHLLIYLLSNSKNFTPGVKILEFKSNRRHQDFPKSKIYTNHSNQNIFGGG